MDRKTLKSLQNPLKESYKKTPNAAFITLNAKGHIGQGITCRVDTGKGLVEAGLHPATGGDGLSACSGDMLLEALAACAGVTLQAVAITIGINLGDETTVTAEGDLDFRGTLAVSRGTPVGFQAIRLHFKLDTEATPNQIETLLQLTERYCVVFQTLDNPPRIIVSH